MNYFFQQKNTKLSLIIISLSLTIVGSPVLININEPVLAQTQIIDIEAKKEK
jgi:hypothetical protein